MIEDRCVIHDKGEIKVHNYPPDRRTKSYITKTYMRFSIEEGWSEFDGDPIYFDDMQPDVLALAIIMATSQNALLLKLKEKK